MKKHLRFLWWAIRGLRAMDSATYRQWRKDCPVDIVDDLASSGSNTAPASESVRPGGDNQHGWDIRELQWTRQKYQLYAAHGLIPVEEPASDGAKYSGEAKPK